MIFMKNKTVGTYNQYYHGYSMVFIWQSFIRKKYCVNWDLDLYKMLRINMVGFFSMWRCWVKKILKIQKYMYIYICKIWKKTQNQKSLKMQHFLNPWKGTIKKNPQFHIILNIFLKILKIRIVWYCSINSSHIIPLHMQFI